MRLFPRKKKKEEQNENKKKKKKKNWDGVGGSVNWWDRVQDAQAGRNLGLNSSRI